MLTTFKVSPVDVNTNRLTTVNLRTSLSSLLDGSIESAGSSLDRLIPTDTNGFIQAVHTAFDQHYPLVLSPDDIWLCIVQGFAIHVNENAESLRSMFVNFAGKKEIRIRRDTFRKGSPDNNWTGVIGEFSDNLERFLGKKAELLISDFSTTGPIERAASQVSLMSAMQQYFDFTLSTKCGIPQISLLGTTQDWRNLRNRAEALSEFDLGWWVPSLLKVLDHFVLASYGRADEDFWKSFYKLNEMSGGIAITGWINSLFPYLMFKGKVERNSRVSNLDLEKYGGTFKGGFPLGLSETPFKWEYLGQDIPMQFLGGFVGVSQTEDGSIRPAIGWAVRETE